MGLWLRTHRSEGAVRRVFNRYTIFLVSFIKFHLICSFSGSDGSSFETTVKDRSTGCTVFGYVDKAENVRAFLAPVLCRT